MKYSDELIEEVRVQNDIVDVVGSVVKIQKKGSSYFGLCPFHNEKSPSFSVSGVKQMFYCFGCGAGGNVISFVMKYENYSFQEALKYLADRAGITLPEIEMTKEEKARSQRKTLILEANTEAAKYYYYALHSPAGQVGMDYLKERKLSDETIRKFGLGFAGISFNGCVKYLQSKGFSDDIIRDSGIASFDEKRGMTDKFFNRVMYPIFDITNHVIGFGGRVMSDAKPKYLNSPETEVFDKSRNLYGLNIARTSRKNYFILCEGYMDVISMHQAGFSQAVASLGTAFTSGQASLLHRYSDNAYLAYDSDGAGINAALRAIGILREVGMTCKIINMKPYKDPDEFIKNLGNEEFEKRIQEAENSFMFEIRMLEGNFDLNDPDEKTKFIKEIANRLCTFEDEIVRDNYLSSVVGKYNINSDSLKREVGRIAASNGGEFKTIPKPLSGIQPKDPNENTKKMQRFLLTWICDCPKIYRQIKEYISPDDFQDGLYKTVAEMLFRDIENDTMNPAKIVSFFSDEDEQKEVAAIFNTELDMPAKADEKEKALHDIVIAVKRNSLETMNSKQDQTVNDMMKAIEDKRRLEKLTNVKFHIDF